MEKERLGRKDKLKIQGGRKSVSGEIQQNGSGFNSYTGNPAGLVGAGDGLKDPRDKWSKSQEQENSVPGGAPPESLTFKERQRLFSQGKEVSNKVKASRKLMELENELNTKQ